jgi:hypothetical protein
VSARTTDDAAEGAPAPLVLLFVNQFLPGSATFIHRQLGYLNRFVRVSVVARRRLNADLFPYDDVEVVPRRRRPSLA